MSPIHLHAQDGFFSDARISGAGNLTIGVQPAIYTNTDDFMMIFRGGYGVMPGMDLFLKVGVLGDENYVGAHIQYLLATDGRIAASMLAGVQNYWDPGLKAGFNMSVRLTAFSIYCGLLYQPYFGDRSTQGLLVPIGLEIPVLSNQSRLIMEVNVPANSDGEPFEMISFGLIFRL
ncbi:hypothetical protein QLX67_03120 [Balneolaceae bacterium ANBcel3]|nr:hypothetical protein [Balneolaceae bacterium ANBcel3]